MDSTSDNDNDNNKIILVSDERRKDLLDQMDMCDDQITKKIKETQEEAEILLQQLTEAHQEKQRTLQNVRDHFLSQAKESIYPLDLAQCLQNIEIERQKAQDQFEDIKKQLLLIMNYK